MDGNVTWIDTELDANVGFFLSFFKRKKKKYLWARRKKQFGFKRRWNHDLMEPVPAASQTSASAPVDNFS